MNFKRKHFFLTIFFCFIAGGGFAQSPNSMRVLSYYFGQAAALDNYDMNQMTHIIYCFGHLSGNKYKLDNARDTATIKKMVSLKAKNPDLKVIISLGGWGGCPTCSDVFASKAGRREFAQSVKDLHTYFGTDGLDLDWEYPTVEGYPGHKHSLDDKVNFTKLVTEIRKTNPNKELSFAAGASEMFLDSAVEWKKVMKKVDYVNLMTYDLMGGGAKVVGHHTNLYSNSGQTRSGDFAVQYLLKLGIPSKKLIYGAAFYGRLFKDVGPTNNGLYQPGTHVRGINYKTFINTLTPENGYVYHWDDAAQAPYLYNADKKELFTFDDKRSIDLKAKYVVDHNMGGIMFWDLSGDTYKDGLLNTIDQVKKNYHPTK